MKKTVYQLLYRFLSVCSNRWDSKMLIRYKLIVGSALLFLNNGYAQSKQEQSLQEATPIEQDTIQSGEENPQTFICTMEAMPEFPGGQGELLKYMSKEVAKYPPSDSWKMGRSILSFTIDSLGKISDVKVMRSQVTLEQDSIAVQIIENMPDWSPGKLRGQLQSVKYTIPVTFRDFKKTDSKTQ